MAFSGGWHMSLLVLLINPATALLVTSFIWTMQTVHYPLQDPGGK